MSAMIFRRRVTLAMTLLLLVASVALSDAFGLNGGTVTVYAICGAIIAGAAAILCGIFVRTPHDSFEHSVARTSLVALAIVPPALALRAAVSGALELSPDDQQTLVVASSVWLVLAGVFTASVLHLAERYELSRHAPVGRPHAPHARSA